MASATIAVLGPGGPNVDPDVLAIAEEVGARVARAGAALVCGGLDGVMEAAARGAASAGGAVIGILPGTDRAAGNRYLSVAIPTGMGEIRNALVVRTADAVIAVGGGYGTLSEIGLALKTGRLVVGIGTWELRRAGTVDAGIVCVETAEEAVAAVVSDITPGRMTGREGG